MAILVMQKSLFQAAFAITERGLHRAFTQTEVPASFIYVNQQIVPAAATQNIAFFITGDHFGALVPKADNALRIEDIDTVSELIQ
jgi:hypothetical protein